jgi:hypothetical protein
MASMLMMVRFMKYLTGIYVWDGSGAIRDGICELNRCLIHSAFWMDSS